MSRSSIARWSSVAVCLGSFFSVAEGQEFQTLDTMVLVESSGSIGATDWSMGNDFLAAFVEQARPLNSRIAIGQFASSVVREYEFTDDQSDAAVLSAINGMAYIGGFAHMRDALLDAVALYDEQSFWSHDKLIMIITDGKASPLSEQDPCDLRDTLLNAGINVVVAGLGSDWSPSHIECLVQDEAMDIARVADFSSETFNFDRFRSIAGPPIPAVSEWGLAVMALLVGTAGTIALTRRHSLAG